MPSRRFCCASVAAIADFALPVAVSFATSPATRRTCSAMRHPGSRSARRPTWMPPQNRRRMPKTRS